MTQNLTGTTLHPPLLILPVHLTTLTDTNPVFLWNGRFNASGYLFEIRNEDTGEMKICDSGFEVSETDPMTSIEPSVRFKLPQPLSPGQWRWRVACKDSEGHLSSFSTGRTFSIDTHDIDAIRFSSNLRRPYLHFGSNRLARLKGRIVNHSNFQLALERLIATADFTLDHSCPEEAYITSDHTQHQLYNLLGGITWTRAGVLGMAWQLTADERYARALRDHLQVLAGYERWVGEQFLDPGKFDPPWHASLETAMTSYGFAIGYDWIYDFLTPSERQHLRQALLDKGIKPLVHAWVNPETCARIPRHQVPGGNWAMVCACGAGVAALSILEECAEAAHWIRQVRDRVRWWLHYEGGEYMADWPWSGQRPKEVIGPDDPNFGIDGAYRESIGYMHYAMIFVSYFSDALRQVSNVDLFEHYPAGLLDQIVATIYRHNKHGLDLDWITNFGDGVALPNFHELYCCLMRNRKDGIAKALQDRIFGEIPTTARSLLWYDPKLPAEPIQFSRAGKYFRDIGVASFKTGSARRGAHCALKTRQNRGHHDIGAMYFYSGGNTWISDSGVYDYTSEIYQGFLVHSKAQNLILVDNMNQTKNDGVLETFLAGQRFGYTRAELANAYPDRLISWKREMALIGPDTFIMVDHLRGKGVHHYEWLMHPNGKTIVTPGQSLEITGPNESLNVTVISPSNWKYEIRDGYDRHVPRSYYALMPIEDREDENFIVVYTPTVGEAGPAQVIALPAPDGIRHIRIHRPDIALVVIVNDTGKPVHIEDIETDAAFAVYGYDRHTGERRLCALGSGTYIKYENSPVITSTSSIDISAEWHNGGMLSSIEAHEDKVSITFPARGMNGALLDNAGADIWMDQYNRCAFTFSKGRHKLILSPDWESLETRFQLPVESPMVRTRPDAPAYHGLQVRASCGQIANGLEVFDENDMVQWTTCPNLPLPQWISATLPEPKAISRIAVTPVYCHDLVVEVQAIDNGEWLRVGAVENTPPEQPVEFSFAKKQVQAIRVTFTKTSDPKNVCGLWNLSWR